MLSSFVPNLPLHCPQISIVPRGHTFVGSMLTWPKPLQKHWTPCFSAVSEETRAHWALVVVVTSSWDWIPFLQQSPWRECSYVDSWIRQACLSIAFMVACTLFLYLLWQPMSSDSSSTYCRSWRISSFFSRGCVTSYVLAENMLHTTCS